MTERKKHFSMLRTFALADLFTFGNVLCGMGAIFACLHQLATNDHTYLKHAFWLMPLALVMDGLDGRVARWRQKNSILGADLDSLADTVSFGVAPAVLGYTMGMRTLLDQAVFMYFVACGISRLARFNVTAASLADETGKVKYFEGTPIPTSLLIVLLLGIQHSQGRLGETLWGGLVQLGPLDWHPFNVAYLILGSTMISATLRIPKI